MSARLGPGGLLFDHGQPLRKLAMDGAPAAPMALDEVLALLKTERARREHSPLETLIPHLHRL